MDEEAARRRQAKEDRHERSHDAGTAWFLLSIGTAGTLVTGWLVKDAQVHCLGLRLSQKPDLWCTYVGSGAFHPQVTPLVIGALIGILGYAVLYVYHRLVD